MLTHNGVYKWFYFEPSLIEFLTDEEKGLVEIENLNDGFVKLYYPKDAYADFRCHIREVIKAKKGPATNSKNTHLLKELKAAIAIIDFDEIENIKQRMKDEKLT